MSSGPIRSAADYPLSDTPGNLPQMADVIQEWLQPIKAMRVSKSQNQSFQTVEGGEPINFQGVLVPLDARKLEIKTEGERDWEAFSLWCPNSVRFENDDVVWISNRRYRILYQRDYSRYGFFEYHVLQDYDDRAPSPTFDEPGPPIPFGSSMTYSGVIDLSDPDYPSALVSVIGDGGISDAFATEWRVYTLNNDGSLLSDPDVEIQVIDELTIQLTAAIPGVYQLNGVQ